MSPNTKQEEVRPKEVVFLDLIIVLARHKWIVLAIAVISASLTGAVGLLMPNLYTATARILPPQQSQSAAAAMLGQIGAVAGVSSASFGLKNPTDLYIGMLSSRTISDAVISGIELQRHYGERNLADTRRILRHNSSITSTREGIIAIEVTDTDPTWAANIANSYVRELEKINERLAVTEAAQRRLFLEKQLSQAKEALASAEIELMKTQQETGLIKLDEQGRAIIDAVASIRGQIAAKEVQMATIRAFATRSNPELVRAESELAGLREQLRRLERKSTNNGASIFMPTDSVPAAGLEYIRKVREVKYQETIFELLAKQYELAKMDEARDASLIQVLDNAIAPEERSRPQRTKMVLVATILGGLVGVIVALLKEALAQARRDPEQASRLTLLRAHLGILGRSSSQSGSSK